jgi:hypothetical protein
MMVAIDTTLPGKPALALALDSCIGSNIFSFLRITRRCIAGWYGVADVRSVDHAGHAAGAAHVLKVDIGRVSGVLLTAAYLAYVTTILI